MHPFGMCRVFQMPTSPKFSASPLVIQPLNSRSSYHNECGYDIIDNQSKSCIFDGLGYLWLSGRCTLSSLWKFGGHTIFNSNLNCPSVQEIIEYGIPRITPRIAETPKSYRISELVQPNPFSFLIFTIIQFSRVNGHFG
jgi:hypothetical protein